MLAPLGKQASHIFAENANFEKRETAPKSDERGVWRVPDGGGKVQYALLMAGRGNSTVPGEFGTEDFVRKKNGEKQLKKRGTRGVGTGIVCKANLGLIPDGRRTAQNLVLCFL